MFLGRKDLLDLQIVKFDFDYSRITDKNIAKLDANELDNNLSSAIAALAAESIRSSDFGRYPDPNSSVIKKLISEDLRVSPDNIVVGNGSDELLNNLFLGFYGMKAMIPDVSYAVYYHLSKLNNIDLVPIQLTKDFDLPLDILDQMKSEEPDIVFLSYPNNPTGTLFNVEIIKNLIESFPQTAFIIDEAYYEFSEKTFIEYAMGCSNVMILRTFSKIFSLAGLRIGYAISNNGLIDILNKTKLIYSVNALSQNIFPAIYPLLKSNLQATKQHIEVERVFYEKAFADLLNIPIIQSAANFIFIPLPEHLNVSDLKTFLKANNIYVRFFSYPSRGNFMRFSLGSQKHNYEAFSFIEKYFKQLKRQIA